MSKVAREVSEQEFERMCVANRVQHEEIELSEEERAAFLDLKRKIVRAIEDGTLTVDAEGQPTYTPQDGSKPVTFHRTTGASLMAMEHRTDQGKISQLVAAMTEMTKSTPGGFSKMHLADFKVCMAIASLFLSHA